MSDAIEISIGSLNKNGSTVETTLVKFGPPEARRSAEFRKLGIEDEWDLSEIATETSSRNWRAMSLVAMSLESIDGKPANPIGSPPRRDDIRRRLAVLGEDGFLAVMEAQSPPDAEDGAATIDPEAAHRVQVGNSLEAPASGN